MKVPLLAIVAITGVPLAQASDVEAGKAKVAAVCAACHGGNGVSVAGSIPNLAGQKSDYIVEQLKAFRVGERKSSLMNPIAGQLNDEEIQNVSAYLASLPGASSGTAKSEVMPALASSRVTFPADYKASFTRYHTIDFSDRKQVHYFYANPAAIEAVAAGASLPDGSKILVEAFSAKLDVEGNPLKTDDGHIAPDEIVVYGVMEKQGGWGAKIPEMLRNEDWHFAAFDAGRTLRDGFNHAICLACHKSKHADGYLFTMKELREFGSGK